MPNQPHSYRDIQDRYNQLKQSRPDLLGDLDLGGFAQQLNEETGSHNFDAAVHPGLLKGLDANLSWLSDWTGASSLGEAIGGTVGSAIGHEQIGRDVGHGLPRAFASYALPALVGGLVAGPPGAAIAGALGGGADTALQTYASTDSPLAALAAGGIAAVAPAMGELGAGLAAGQVGKYVGSTLLKNGIRQSVAGGGLLELATEGIGMQTGFLANQELQRQAVNVATGQGLSFPSVNDAVANLIGTLTPAAFHGATVASEHLTGNGPKARTRSEQININDAAETLAGGRPSGQVTPEQAKNWTDAYQSAEGIVARSQGQADDALLEKIKTARDTAAVTTDATHAADEQRVEINPEIVAGEVLNPTDFTPAKGGQWEGLNITWGTKDKGTQPEKRFVLVGEPKDTDPQTQTSLGKPILMLPDKVRNPEPVGEQPQPLETKPNESQAQEPTTEKGQPIVADNSGEGDKTNAGVSGDLASTEKGSGRTEISKVGKLFTVTGPNGETGSFVNFQLAKDFATKLSPDGTYKFGKQVLGEKQQAKTEVVPQVQGPRPTPVLYPKEASGVVGPDGKMLTNEEAALAKQSVDRLGWQTIEKDVPDPEDTTPKEHGQAARKLLDSLPSGLYDLRDDLNGDRQVRISRQHKKTVIDDVATGKRLDERALMWQEGEHSYTLPEIRKAQVKPRDELPPKVKMVVENSPKTVNQIDVLVTAKKVGEIKVLTLQNFTDVADLHETLMRQVSNNQELASELGLQPITDKWIADRFQDLLDRGMTEREAATRTGAAAREKVLSDLNRVNNALHERNTLTELGGASKTEGSVEFFERIAQENPELAQQVETALEALDQTPFSVPVAVEKWIRRTRLSADEQGRALLQEIKSVHDKIGRRMNPDELEKFLTGKEASLDTKDDIKSQFGALFRRDGQPSEKGAIYNKITAGEWKAPLLPFLREVAKRDEAHLNRGELSLDKAITEDSDTTFGDEATNLDAAQIAREKHVDPVAQEVSEDMAKTRIDRISKVVDEVNKLNEEQISEFARKANIQAPRNKQNFKNRIAAYVEGLALFPETRRGVESVGGEVGKGLGRDRGGLYPWLKDKEPFMDAKNNMTAAITQVEKFLGAFKEDEFKDLFQKPKPPQAMKTKMMDLADKYLRGRKAGTEATQENVNAAMEGVMADTTLLKKDAIDKAVAFSTHEWFNRYYEKLGMAQDDPMRKRLVDSAVRLSLLYPEIDKVRVGTVVGELGKAKGESVEGVYWNKFQDESLGGKLFKFVGLSMGGELDKQGYTTFSKNFALAHEFHHAYFATISGESKYAAVAEKYRAALDAATQMSPEQRQQVLQTMFGAVVPKQLHSPEVLQHLQEIVNYSTVDNPAGSETAMHEFTATFAGLINLGLANEAKSLSHVSNFKNLFGLIPDKLREFTQGYYTNLSQFADGMQGYFNEIAPGLGDNVKTMSDVYKDLARTPRKVDLAMGQFEYIRKYEPDNFINSVRDSTIDDSFYNVVNGQANVDFLADLKGKYGLKINRNTVVQAMKGFKEVKDFMNPDPLIDKTYGKEPGFWWWATPLAQFAERYTVLRPVSDMLMGYDGMVANANAVTMQAFGTKNVFGKLQKSPQLDHLNAVLTNPTARKALNDAFRWQNVNDKRFGPGAKPITKDQLNGLGHKLSPVDQDRVLSVIGAVKDAMDRTRGNNINTSIAVSGTAVGRIALGKDKALQAKRAESLGKDFIIANVGMASEDPVLKAQGVAMMTQLQGTLTPKMFSALNDSAKTLSELHIRMAQRQGQYPNFTPETRPHQFILNQLIDGKQQTDSFVNEAEATKAYAAAQANPKSSKAELINPYLKQAQTGNISDNMASHFVELEKTAFDLAKQQFAGDPEALKQFAQLYTPGAQVMEELAAKGVRKHMMERKLVGGRENIDMITNALNYVESMNRANAKNLIRQKVMLYQADPTLVNEPRLNQIFNDHMNNVLNPPVKSSTTLRNMIFQYYMGGNISSALIEVVQPLQSVMPYLTRQGVGLGDGYKLLGSAAKTLVDHYVLKKPFTDTELFGALDRAVKERVVSFGMMNEFTHIDDGLVANLKNLSNDTGDFAQPATNLLKNTAYQLSRAGRFFFTKASEHNSRLGFIMGFEAARTKGKSMGLEGEQLTDYAYSEAKRLVEVTLHGGGSAARPVGFGKTGGLYGVAGNLYALNQYSFSMLSMMSRLGSEALGSTGLQGGELRNARKAFGQMMFTQAMFAGAMGMPFASGVVAILEQVFPDLELNKGIRHFISKMAGDDEKMGNMLSDAALQGVATAFSPFDVSGRFAMGAVLGTNPYFGFDASQVLGAGGSMFANMVKGVSGASQGDWRQAQSILPTSIQKVLNAAQDGGRVRSAKGDLLFEPTDTQRLMMAIGMRPKEQSHAQQQAMISDRSDKIQLRELNKFYEENEQKVLDGDFAGVRSALYARAQEDPTFSPLVGLKRIVQGAQNRTMVQDSADKGRVQNANDRAAIGKMFGSTPPDATDEVAKLGQRAQLEQQVGVAGAGQVAPHELQQAQMLNYLQQSYGMTLLQAKAHVKQMENQRHGFGVTSSP